MNQESHHSLRFILIPRWAFNFLVITSNTCLLVKALSGLTGNRASGKGTIKKCLWGIYKSPLLFRCRFVSLLLTKTGPATVVCSMEQRRRGRREGQRAKDKGNRGERERQKDTILTFSHGIGSPGE